jgi:hypothetical protein
VVSSTGSAIDRRPAPARCMSRAMAKQVERAPREMVDARHCHHVAGGQLVEHAVKLAPVGSRASHLLTVNLATRAA